MKYTIISRSQIPKRPQQRQDIRKIVEASISHPKKVVRVSIGDRLPISVRQSVWRVARDMGYRISVTVRDDFAYVYDIAPITKRRE